MEVKEVMNSDIKALHSRVNRFIEEMRDSVSSRSSLVNDFDKARLTSYLSALRFYHDYVMTQAPLDLPETHPRLYKLRENPAVPVLENEMMNDIIEKFQLLRDELVNSQSARNSSGLISFDSIRFLSVVSNIETFLSTYVSQATPLDLPESSPRTKDSGPGRLGINPGA